VEVYAHKAGRDGRKLTVKTDTNDQ
jgi:hypothetical protein